MQTSSDSVTAGREPDGLGLDADGDLLAVVGVNLDRGPVLVSGRPGRCSFAMVPYLSSAIDALGYKSFTAKFMRLSVQTAMKYSAHRRSVTAVTRFQPARLEAEAADVGLLLQLGGGDDTRRDLRAHARDADAHGRVTVHLNICPR